MIMKNAKCAYGLLVATLAMGLARAPAQDVVLSGKSLEVTPTADLVDSGAGAHQVVPADFREGLAAKAQVRNLAPGRYAVDFRVAAPRFGRKGDASVTCQVQAPGQPAQSRALHTPDLPSDASPQSVRLVVALPAPSDLTFTIAWAGNSDMIASLPQITDPVDGKDGGSVSKDLPAVHIYDITVHRLDGGLGIVKVFPNKLLYRRGEAGTVAVRVRNFTDQPMSGKLALSLVRELSTVRPAGELEVTVPAGQEQVVEMPFVCGHEEYGHEARVEVRQGGKILDANSDVFNVCDSLWPVAMGGPTVMTGHSGRTDPKGIPSGVLQLRADYVNWWERRVRDRPLAGCF